MAGNSVLLTIRAAVAFVNSSSQINLQMVYVVMSSNYLCYLRADRGRCPFCLSPFLTADQLVRNRRQRAGARVSDRSVG